MKAADRHFHCFACGMDYRVTGWAGPLHTLQDVLLRCINTRGTAHPRYGEGSVRAGVECGAPLGWVSRAYPRSDAGLVITTGWANLTLSTVTPRSIVEARDGALAETARLGAQVDQLRATLDDAHRAIAHLDPDGLSSEVARLHALHETPCPGFVHGLAAHTRADPAVRRLSRSPRRLCAVLGAAIGLAGAGMNTVTRLRVDSRRNTEAREYEPGDDLHPAEHRSALRAEVGVMNAGLGWAKYRLATVTTPMERVPTGVGWPS